MKNNYRRTKTTVSLINYHFVFCPRYRRKIFDIDGVERRFKEFAVLSRMPNLWTRSFFISTAGNVSSETIKWYVDTQKTRY